MDISSQPHTTNTEQRLSVELFGRKIPSPLIVGSGTLIEQFSQIQPYLTAGAGAIVPRTTRKVMQRTSHPTPHLYQYGTKKYPVMVNAEWTGADIEYWRPFLPSMSNNQQTIMSVSGRNIEDCLAVCKDLDQFSGWLYFEINMSCAHSNYVHGMITRDEQHIRDTIKRLKDAGIKTPIAIKLGYSDSILHLSNVAKEEGADAIVAINTYGPVFDFTIDQAGMPQSILGIQGGKGGLSGAPLFPIALTAIAEIKKQINIPVIGCGGAVSALDVVKMMMAGADAVQIYTAAHARGVNAPSYFQDINHDLLKFMDEHNIQALSSVVDKALFILEQETHLDVIVPTLYETKCIGCNLCVAICLPEAIKVVPALNLNKVGHIVELDADKCVGCGHCVPVCPTVPKSLEWSLATV